MSSIINSSRFETTAWSCEKAGSKFKKCSIRGI